MEVVATRTVAALDKARPAILYPLLEPTLRTRPHAVQGRVKADAVDFRCVMDPYYDVSFVVVARNASKSVKHPNTWK